MILQDGLLDGISEEGRREETPAKERPKRAKLIPSPIACKEKPCIICNQSKYKGDTKRWRMREEVRGKIFQAAKNFNNDEVSARCILLNDVGDMLIV